MCVLGGVRALLVPPGDGSALVCVRPPSLAQRKTAKLVEILRDKQLLPFDDDADAHGVADVVVFAAETVGDAATFEEPTLPSTGITSVRKHCLLGCAVSFLNRSDLGGWVGAGGWGGMWGRPGR